MSTASIQLCAGSMKRFHGKVNRSGDCWEWIGSTQNMGYGHFFLNGKMLLAHRVSWVIENGQIPGGMCILHKCDNTLCVNPAHLFIGTMADNSADMVRKGRQRGARKGSAHRDAKLHEQDVLIIRDIYAQGEYNQCQIASFFGVHSTQICRAISGKNWGHVCQQA